MEDDKRRRSLGRARVQKFRQLTRARNFFPSRDSTSSSDLSQGMYDKDLVAIQCY